MTDRPSATAPLDVRLVPVVRSLFAGEIPEDTVFPFPEIEASEHETVSAFLDSFRQFANAPKKSLTFGD